MSHGNAVNSLTVVASPTGLGRLYEKRVSVA